MRHLVAVAALCLIGTPVFAQNDTGQLVVASMPSGAEVSIDGQPAGRTPKTVTGLMPGSHLVEVRWPDGRIASAVPTIVAGTSKLVSLTPGQNTQAPPPPPARAVEPPPARAVEPPPSGYPPQQSAPPPQQPGYQQQQQQPAYMAEPPPPVQGHNPAKKKIGVALTFAGIGAAVLGTILAGASAATKKDAAVPLIAIGSVFIVGGVALVIPGAIIWSKNN